MWFVQQQQPRFVELTLGMIRKGNFWNFQVIENKSQTYNCNPNTTIQQTQLWLKAVKTLDAFLEGWGGKNREFRETASKIHKHVPGEHSWQCNQQVYTQLLWDHKPWQSQISVESPVLIQQHVQLTGGCLQPSFCSLNK